MRALVDRYGQTRSLTAGALIAAFGFILLASGGRQAWMQDAAVLLSGAAKPPLDASFRALLGPLMPTREHKRVALALDVGAQESIYIVGPILVAGIASTASTRVALLATALLGVAGTLIVVTAAPSRSWKGGPQRPDLIGPLRSPSLRWLYLALLCTGIPMGALAPIAVQVADRLHDQSLCGTLPASVSIGALLGGLAYGARTWPGTTAQQLRVFCGGFAVGWLPLLVAGTPTAALMACVLPGVAMAPLLSAAWFQASELAPEGADTEASALAVAAADVGCALGAAAVGASLTQALLPAGGAAAWLLLWLIRNERSPTRTLVSDLRNVTLRV
ncbi:MFS transporter [Streptomyces sp. NPDC047009]|uniref:MFS transporter n=1 Tax=Streptomyces sp. NPDC047009 TaxID=3154496 RepID=UPI0034016C52